MLLRPTALQHLRGFLAESGAGLPPWSTSDEVLDELVALLRAHRGDDAFFARLRPFVQELREHAARGSAGLTARDAEVLSRATVDSLVEELQAQLRDASPSAASKVVSAVMGDRAARLLCLALLSSGLVACSQRPAEPAVAQPASGPAGAKPAPAKGDGLVEMFKQNSPEQAAQALERALDAGVAAPIRAPVPRYKGVSL